jgi:hypothetical protein
MPSARPYARRTLDRGAALLAALIVASCATQPPPPYAWATGRPEMPAVKKPEPVDIVLVQATENATLHSPSGQADDQFGAAVALSLNTLVVGAPGASGGGAAWVFDLSDADARPVKLVPPRLSGGDAFGTSVSISDSGRFIAVGAPWTRVEKDANAGAVHVWERKDSEWMFMGTFTGESIPANSGLGSSVAIEDDTLLAGAPFALVNTSYNHGVVVSWMRDQDGEWSESATMMPDPDIFNARFGGAMSLKGTFAIIGACYARAADQAEGGIAYIYQRRRTGWPRLPLVQIMETGELRTESQQDMKYGRGPGDHFGWAVAILGSAAITGSPDRSEGSMVSNGSVDIFARDRNTWVQVEYISAPDKHSGDCFGSAVGIAGTQFVMGAPLRTTAAVERAGAAYVYELVPGTIPPASKFLVQLVASKPRSGGRFGAVLACTSDIIAISEPGTTSAAVPGLVRIFKRTEDSWGVPIEAFKNSPASQPADGANPDGVRELVAPPVREREPEPPHQQMPPP